MQDLSKLGDMLNISIDHQRTLRYLKAGSGEPLLLLHTIRTQLDYFQYVIPQLSEHFTVYALDLPGHGYSSIDKSAHYDEPYFRSAVVSFIEKLDLKNVTIAGESIGAVIALTVASQLPERVKSVIASNTYDYDKRYGDGVRRGNFFANFIIGNFAIPVHGAIFAALENKLLLGLIMRGGLKAKRGLPDGLLTEINNAGQRKGFRYVERSTFAGWRSWARAREKYAAVKAPVTLVYGDLDWSTPAERKRTAEALKVQPIILKDTGHFAFVDRPEKLAEIILNIKAKGLGAHAA
ncbi:MAG TPA: alpha/beta hydrolase [Methylophilaceae bacterium]|nr:alpha/beta hydrolase [Methylophilaceae bacterium]